MNTRTWFGQRREIYGLAAAAAIAAGAMFAVAQAPVPPATAPATRSAPAAAPDKKAQSIERFKKAADLYKAEKIAEAKVENDAALALDPTNPDALLLRRILSTRTTTTDTTSTGPSTTATAPTAFKARTLTNEEVSLIRLHEMSRDEFKTIQASIDRKTLTDFWDKVYTKDTRNTRITREDREAFLNPRNIAGQIDEIVKAGQADYIEKIKVTSEPKVLVDFRTQVQPFVLQNCATAACHGGDNVIGPRFFGAGRAPSAAETYTNYFTLAEYRVKSGGRMIDRANPRDSLLLQYALPKNISRTPHPGDAKLITRFANDSDPKYQDMVKWIGTMSLNPPQRYGITVNLGENAATTTQPAKSE